MANENNNRFQQKRKEEDSKYLPPHLRNKQYNSFDNSKYDRKDQYNNRDQYSNRDQHNRSKFYNDKKENKVVEKKKDANMFSCLAEDDTVEIKDEPKPAIKKHLDNGQNLFLLKRLCLKKIRLLN